MAVLGVLQLGELEKLLGRQMIKWMADDESFIMSYWHISSDEAARRCQLDIVPNNEYGYDCYYLFKIYRQYEMIQLNNIKPIVVNLNNIANDKTIALLLSKIKNVKLKAKIEAIVN